MPAPTLYFLPDGKGGTPMFPHIQIFLRQTSRSKARLMLNIVLLCVATAFSVLSINLYYNSANNLRTVENSYTSIATMVFSGYVNRAGELVHPGDESSVGYHWLSVEDYDFSKLLALDSVKSIDRRTRVGAYIPGHIPVYQTDEDDKFIRDGWLNLFAVSDVIRFTLDAEEPMVISLSEYEDPGNPYDHQFLPFPIKILEQGNPLLSYPDQLTLEIRSPDGNWAAQYADEIRRLNRSDCADSITLYPGVEYVIACRAGQYWTKDQETGRYIWVYDDYMYPSYGSIKNEIFDGPALKIWSSNYYEERFFYYERFGLRIGYDSNGLFCPEAPFGIQRYEDVKDDPEWAEYTQASLYSASSFSVTLTENISRIPAWYEGAMFLHEGRMITEEEYASGAKVCMVSAKMAERQGWQVGDTLDMHLYSYDYYFDEAMLTSSVYVIPSGFLNPPVYLKDCDGFFEEDTYTIVGIFGQRQFADFGETAEAVYYNPWNAIYIPTNAAPNAPKGPIQPSLITIHLKNGGIGAFKQAVEEMGLTEFRTGERQIKFSYFDQGYSKIKPGLDEMNRNAVLLLSLSTILLLTTMVLLAFLFSQSHKHSAGILRILGGSKAQAFSSILTCSGLVVFISSALGAALGGSLTAIIGVRILGDTASISKVALHTGVNPTLTLLVGLGCTALFLLLVACFTATYIGKEPRALLPQSKA